MTLQGVFDQATNHKPSAHGDSLMESYYLWHGIQICKDKSTRIISIYNTSVGGNYYAEISSSQYEVFKDEGWRMGVYYMASLNYRRKIETINKRIQNLINKTKYSDKQYRNLKESRSRYLRLLTNTIINSTKIKSNENY